MLLVRASIRPSRIHGLGCFTEEPIARGQAVWVFDPRLDTSFREAELDALPPAARALLEVYGYVERNAAGERVVILCGDHARHMNHADVPNLDSVTVGGVLMNHARRDIAAGEELTCDYRTFDLWAEAKLGR